MSFDLNKQQQDVLEHTKGPLLVVAGAGTGKTRVIVEKINKLLEAGVEPSKILALTFTEKAAAEMLDRVLESRGGLLPDLPVMTFNGFGDLLLREYGINAGIARNFKLLGPKAQIVFMRERIDEFALDYFLPLTSSPDAIIEDILKLFSQLKQHVITPDVYTNYAESLSAQDEAESLEKQKHQELSGAFKKYIALCRTENVIDYDDQIYLSFQLLKERPNVQRELQERFHTMFIDEFQDTNPIQSKLIDLLMNKEQNVVVVGDDDQSIYGFRGATLQNILSFKERYPKTKEVVLTENYRSHQSILDSAYRLIQYNNPHRLESTLQINKRLHSKKGGSAPFLKRFNEPGQEIAWLAADIANRIAAGESPGNIAVLTRRNQTAQIVHEALTLHGVEHKVVGAKQDLYTRPVVRMLIELLRTVTEPENNVSLHHTLASELFGISNQSLAQSASKARFEHTLLEEVLRNQKNDTQIHEALDLIHSLRDEAASMDVRIVVWNAIDQSGYYEKLKSEAFSSDSKGNDLLHLSQFFDSLREFESIAIQPTTAQYLLSLPALMAAGETTEDGTLEINDHQVTVTTVHKAKGLEWNSVYIPDVTELSFPWRRRGGGLNIPDELRNASESPADDHYAEERRLMYVAATRARQNLLISYSDTSKSGAPRKPSRFINELFGEDTAENTAHAAPLTSNNNNIHISTEKLKKVSVPSSILREGKVRLSVSEAVVLMDCPLNFYYKFIFKAPEEPTPRTTYGSYLHAFFESINKERMSNSLRPLDEFIQEMEAGWQRAGYVSKATQEKAYNQAHETLTNFYEEAKIHPAAVAVEEPFEVELDPEGIILRGKVDVVLDRDGIEIRDYKTGTKVKTEDAAKKRATSSAQLTMYALAWQVKHGDIPAKLSLDFVDTGMVGSVKKTQRGIDGLRSRLKAAAEHIIDGHFPAGSRHDYCIHPPIGE